MAALAAAVLALGAVVVAQAAGPGPNNSWTQEYNQYTNQGGNSAGDGHCYSSCIQWGWGPSGYWQGYWSWNVSGSLPSWFHADAAAAVADANSIPANSPSFTERSSACQYDVCFIVGNLVAGRCGQTDYTSVSSGTIYQATVTIAAGMQFYDGPVPPNRTGCDLRATLHHEMGHVLGLGHSTVTSDLMFYIATNEAFGQDERNGLNALYLNNQSGGGGDACRNCQTICEDAMGKLSLLLSLSDPCGPTGVLIPPYRYPGTSVSEVTTKAVAAVDGALGLVPHVGAPR